MIVLFTPKETDMPNGIDFLPGPLSSPDSKAFMTAYTAMATKAGYTLYQAMEIRYEYVLEQVQSDDGDSDRKRQLQEELDKFGTVPGTHGSEARKEYFTKFVENQKGPEMPNGNSDSSSSDLLNFLRNNPSGQASFLNAIQSGNFNTGRPAGRPVRAPGLDVLKQAVDAHPTLSWDDRLMKIAGQIGQKRTDDPKDNTSQVEFSREGFTCWLPTETLEDIGNEG